MRLTEQVELLVRSLESDSENVRNGIIVQLSLFGSKIVPQLTRDLDKYLDVESMGLGRGEPKNSYLELAIDGILKSLGMIQDPSPVEIIERALPRKEAVEALSKIGGSKSLDLILSSMEAPVDEWGNQPGGALRNFVDSEQKGSRANDDFVRNVFINLGDPGRLRLKEDLSSPVPRRRAVVASILRAMHDKDSTPQLLAILKSKDLGPKAEAAHALQELNSRDLEPELIKELFSVERMIVDLELSESKQASDLLLYDQLREARDVIESAVLALGDPSSLVEVGFHPSPVRRDTSKFSVRPEFRKAIIESGESAMPALTKFLTTSQEKSVQSSAAEIIAEIKKREESENTTAANGTP